jgi:(p)ppGpp synthase/HD superfamily hydrolase
LGTVLSPRFEDALVYAARIHAGQKRKGKDVPYIAHLLGVTGIALEVGADEDQAIAALLHDAVEDQGGEKQHQQIQKRFGDRVARIVADCSDSWILPKPPWQGRKEAYLQHLLQVSLDSMLVSCADKLDNARTILEDYRQVGEVVWDRFTGGREGTLWYYRALVERFRAAGLVVLVDELDLVVSELEKLTTTNQGSQ